MEAQVLAGGEAGVEAGGFDQEANAGTHAGGVPAYVEPVHECAAGGGLEYGAEQAQQSGLAGAIGPQQAQDLAVVAGERDTSHRRQFAEAFGELLGFDHLSTSGCLLCRESGISDKEAGRVIAASSDRREV